MGLDMYLEARKYVGRIDWKAVPQGGLPDGASFNDYTSDEFNVLKSMFPKKLTKYTEAGSSVAINIGYWRKANQIHGWFVDNVQAGEDDCREYGVERHKLVELLDTVTKVLDGDKETAKELLPVRGGFFFGNYDEEEGYDEWYYEALKYTKDMLTSILDVVPENNTDYSFYYQSSW
jgi:hypothetical protein